jgi:hypothetical protein
MDTSSPEERYSLKNPVIVLLFDSQCPENKMNHLKRYKATSNYDFTVKQRLLAKEAKVVKTIDELEDSVSHFLYYLHLSLHSSLVMQLDKNYSKGYRERKAGFVRLNPDLFNDW